MTKKALIEMNGGPEPKKLVGKGEPEVEASQTHVLEEFEPSPKRSKTDVRSKDRPAPERKKKKDLLPNEPVGTRYEESMRPPRVGAGRTIMSWNVAGMSFWHMYIYGSVRMKVHHCFIEGACDLVKCGKNMRLHKGTCRHYRSHDREEGSDDGFKWE
jgi:hypothetical protein